MCQNLYESQNSRIREATDSSSHFGVDVAPHTPTRSSGRNHSVRTSPAQLTLYVLMFTERHKSQRTLPLELSFPDTNMMISWDNANSDRRLWRPATCWHMVSCTTKSSVPLKGPETFRAPSPSPLPGRSRWRHIQRDSWLSARRFPQERPDLSFRN